MNKFSSLLLVVFIFLSISCSDDDDDSTNPSTNNNSNNNSTSTQITGTYTGTEITTYKEKGTSTILQIDTFTETYTIQASGSSYQLLYDDNGTVHTLNLSVNGNNFTATGPPNDPWFSDETYSGSVSGNDLTMSYSGEDIDQGTAYTYTANYSGSKSSSGGNGGGNSGTNLLSIPNESNSGVSGIVDCQSAVMEASFGTSNQDQWYAVEIGFDSDVDQLSPGTYSLVSKSTFPLASNECYIYISFQDFNSGQIDNKSFESNNSSGQFVTVSKVNGNVNVKANGVLLENIGTSHTESINVELNCP